jgi:hypothetical protein
MGLQVDITQAGRLQPVQHRVAKTTKNMAPTRHTYSLRSKRLFPKVLANEAAPNDEADAIEVQLPPATTINRSQPLIGIEQLSAALEEQRVVFTRQLSTALEEQRTAFLRQHEASKAEIATLLLCYNFTEVSPSGVTADNPASKPNIDHG